MLVRVLQLRYNEDLSRGHREWSSTGMTCSLLVKLTQPLGCLWLQSRREGEQLSVRGAHQLWQQQLRLLRAPHAVLGQEDSSEQGRPLRCRPGGT